MTAPGKVYPLDISEFAGQHRRHRDPPTKLWLWRNGDHFLAYANEYPCESPHGDPLTIGQPAATALYYSSVPRAEPKTKEVEVEDLVLIDRFGSIAMRGGMIPPDMPERMSGTEKAPYVIVRLSGKALVPAD